MRHFLGLYHGWDDAETARMEQVLGVARAFLATAGLIAIFLDPTEPASFATAVYAVLSAYAVYSLLVLVALKRILPTPRRSRTLHAVDIVVASVLTSLSEGPASPFFLFFIYALLAAAYRWRLHETILTAVVALAIYMAQVAVLTHHVDLIFVITRSAYLLMAGGLLGYLADQEKQIRAELRALNEATQTAERRVSPRMARFARLMRRLFDARVAVVILDQPHRGRAWSWVADSDASPSQVRRQRLSSEDRQTWLFEAPDTWCVTVDADGRSSAFVPQPGSWSLASASMVLPAGLPAGGPFRTLMGAAVPLGSVGRVRVLLLDPASSRLRTRLNFLSRLARHTAPSLANVLLVHRLRARATADERARVARELHDGAIQSLVGIELRTAALLRQPGATTPAVAGELEAIQGLLRDEVVALRTLMLELRKPDLEDAAQLPAAIDALAERFRRDTGIDVHVNCHGDLGRLSQRTAIELARIVQEALVNVRKHSGASRVEIVLAPAASGWQLTIEDDGRGLPDAGGTATPTSRWPAIIRERTRDIGGTLALASRPGRGLRLDIAIPEETRV